jgi:hypothetical protein
MTAKTTADIRDPGKQDEKRTVTNISWYFILNSMKSASYLTLFFLLMALLLFTAGCTASQGGGGTPPPAGTAAPGTPQSGAVPAATSSSTGYISTTIGVRYNDFTCLNIQDQLGVTYLYPGQTVTLTASPPASGGVNVNVLMVNENDQIGLQEIKPKWDIVQKTWVYAGIVPIIQLNDVTGTVEKTATITTQHVYYLCVDDRKESGTSNAIYQVPVTLSVV